MKRQTLFLCMLVLLLACNDSTDKKEKEEVLQTEDVAEPEEQNILQTSFTAYFAYISSQDASFSKDSFNLAEEGKMESLPSSTIEPARLDPFKKYLVYNSDSSLAIDLYSYNYILTKRNGEEKMEEAGPDTEVSLVDLKNNTARRIFFSGPSFTVADAKWISNNEVALAGAENLEDGKIKPVIWQINIKDTTIQQYNYNHIVKADVLGYVAKRVLK
jgi:hypothetical protein